MRRPKVYWEESSRSWRSFAVGPVSAQGRRTGIRNRDIGPPVGRDGVSNRIAAEKWLAQLLEAEASAARKGDEPTLSELAAAYHTWCKDRVLPRTVQGYRERLAAFCFESDSRGVQYGSRLVRTLGPADVDRVARLLRGRGRAAVWARDVTGAARACTAWGARLVPGRVPERILSADPFADSEAIEVPPPPKRYVGSEVRRAFFKGCRARLATINRKTSPMSFRFDRLAVCLWRFLERTGARPDEACRLEWEHIDWDDRVATMRTKTGVDRIPLPRSIIRMLRAIETLPGRHDRYVFTHLERKKGGSQANVGNLAGVEWSGNALAHKFKKWRDEMIAAGAAIEAKGPRALTLYQLRRDVGSDILRDTGSHALSAEVLRHSPEVNRRNYSSFEAGRAVQLADRLEEKRRGGS